MRATGSTPPVDFSKAVEDEDQDGVVTYYAFYSENQTAADDAANGEEAAEQEAAGDDAEAADESSIAPQTGDATNVAAVAGIGGIAGRSSRHRNSPCRQP